MEQPAAATTIAPTWSEQVDAEERAATERPKERELLPETTENTKIVVGTSDGKALAPIYAAVSKFEDLRLKPELLQGVYAKGYSRPSKIQEVSLPLILNDPPQNIIAQAQSGTGKTAAFSLGMLSRVDPSQPFTQALCVCHTRELAFQIFGEVSALGKFLPAIQPLLAVPEANIPRQITNQIVIGTPGTVSTLIKNKALNTSRIRVFVLDEADVMMEAQGLATQTIRLKSSLPGRGAGCQMLLFSATYSEEVMKFSNQVVPDPHVSIRLERKDESLDAIAQFFIDCANEEQKFTMLSDLYCYLTIGQSIIFVNRRDTAMSLAQRMSAGGHAVSVLTGEMKADERDRVLGEFRSSKTKVLITTNVLSRGIDIMAITLVINYDMPVDPTGRVADFSTYLHRIGRSGRFGRQGIAINFAHNDHSRRLIQDIAGHFQRPIEQLRNEDIPKLDAMLREIQ